MLTAFIVGWFGLLHCYGMCGGIMGAMSMSLATEVRTVRKRLLLFTLLYGLGRITSYTIAGAISGLIGQIFADLLKPLIGSVGVSITDEAVGVGYSLRAIAGIIVVGIGAHVAGWWPRLAYLEKLGDPLWQYLWPVVRQLLPVRTPLQAWLFGIFWGWLPCGLVYSMLMIAALSKSPWQGGFLMLAFGSGTLPGLWFGGILSAWLVHWRDTPWLQAIAGLVLIASGLVSVYSNIILYPYIHRHEPIPAAEPFIGTLYLLD